MGGLSGPAQHRYQTCHDDDCERFACRVYKEGFADGFDAGYGCGFDAGHAVGYAEGHSDGYAAGAAAASSR